MPQATGAIRHIRNPDTPQERMMIAPLEERSCDPGSGLQKYVHAPLLELNDRPDVGDPVLVLSTPSPEHLTGAAVFTTGPLECLNPKTTKRVDPRTGEITREIVFRYEESLGRYLPVRCGRTDCGACCVWNARRIAGAIWLSQPDYALTLTLPGIYDYETISARVNTLFKVMMKIYPTFKQCWMAELNPGGTGSHVLCYIHCDDPISQTVIGQHWSDRVDLVTVGEGAAVSWFAYQLKTVTSSVTRSAYINLNNPAATLRPTLIHASKQGFWRDGRGGEPITRAQAEVLANRRRKAL